MKRWLLAIWLAAFALMIVFALWPRSSKKPEGQTNALPGASNSSIQLPTPNTVTPETGQTQATRPSVQPLIDTSLEVGKTAAPSTVSKSAAAPAAVSLAPDFSDPAPDVVIDNMRRTFRLFASKFGSNPVGTNPEITKTLNGDNPKHTLFIRSEDGLRINEAGELIDPWGTPFFFHQLSAKEMEIHSAGADRVMWTDDDLVTK